MRYQSEIHSLSEMILDKDAAQVSQIIRGFERIESRKAIFKIRSRHRCGHFPCQASAALSRVSHEMSSNPRYCQKTVRFEHHSALVLIDSFAHHCRNTKR